MYSLGRLDASCDLGLVCRCLSVRRRCSADAAPNTQHPHQAHLCSPTARRPKTLPACAACSARTLPLPQPLPANTLAPPPACNAVVSGGTCSLPCASGYVGLPAPYVECIDGAWGYWRGSCAERRERETRVRAACLNATPACFAGDQQRPFFFLPPFLQLRFAADVLLLSAQPHSPTSRPPPAQRAPPRASRRCRAARCSTRAAPATCAPATAAWQRAARAAMAPAARSSRCAPPARGGLGKAPPAPRREVGGPTAFFGRPAPAAPLQRAFLMEAAPARRRRGFAAARARRRVYLDSTVDFRGLPSALPRRG